MEAQPDAEETKAGTGRRWGACPGERGAWVEPAWAGNKALGQGVGSGADWLRQTLLDRCLIGSPAFSPVVQSLAPRDLIT